MKTIKQSTVLKGFDQTTPLQQGTEILTLKDILLACLGRFVSQDGKQVIAAYAMGCKLHGCTEPSFDVEDADFEVIKVAVSQNGSQTGPQFTAVVMGQVHNLLNEEV